MKRFINVVPSELNSLKVPIKNKVKIVEKVKRIITNRGRNENISFFRKDIDLMNREIIRLIERMRRIRMLRKNASSENNTELKLSHAV